MISGQTWARPNAFVVMPYAFERDLGDIVEFLFISNYDDPLEL